MSIIFCCAGVERETWTPYPEDASYTATRPVYPFFEVDLSSDNAFAIQRILDPAVTPQSEGEWAQEKLVCIHKRLMILLNTDKKNVLMEAAVIDKSNGMAQYHYMGRSEEYVTRTLTKMLTLVTLALQHKINVHFY